jgi:hypothetical protein
MVLPVAQTMHHFNMPFIFVTFPSLLSPFHFGTRMIFIAILINVVGIHVVGIHVGRFGIFYCLIGLEQSELEMCMFGGAGHRKILQPNEILEILLLFLFFPFFHFMFYFLRCIQTRSIVRAKHKRGEISK